MRHILTTLMLIFFSGTLFAQSADTVYVPAEDEGGNPLYNSMIDYIVADTNASGELNHMYYKLERGKYYVINSAVVLKSPAHIVADPPTDGIPPAVIISNINEEGGTSTGSLIVTYEDITVKNIWLTGMDLGGVNHGWGTQGAVQINKEGGRVVLDGVWCDFNSWSSFGTSLPHTKWYINNFHARNEQNAGDQWTTFLFYMEGASIIDTFIVTNSSYFQSNSCFLFPPAVVQYMEANHCTFVNSYKWPFHHTQWLDAKFNNNIFLNSGSLGLTVAEAESQDPDDLMFGLVNVDTLFANSNDTIPAGEYTIPENERKMEVRNNLWYYSTEIDTYLAGNPDVLHPVFFNDRTQAMFDNDTDWPGFVAENNWNQDPMFNDFADLSVAIGRLSKACSDIRHGSTHGWDWDGDEGDEFYKTMFQYPTAENFASSSGLKATDGVNPLGDLTQYDPSLVGIRDLERTPVSFALGQNFPNPFNPTTTIGFDLKQKSSVMLTIYNLLGKKIKTLINEPVTAGTHEITWDGTNEAGVRVTSGFYFYKLEVESTSITKKMLMLK